MGFELLRYTTFRHSLQMVENCLRDFGCEWILIDELLKEESHSNINNPELSQTICTAVQIVIVDLLRTFHIRPTVIVGHSSGEIGAAYASGALSLRSACQIAYFRGKLSSELIDVIATPGSMLAVGLSETEIAIYMEELSINPSDQVVVACINSPRSVTISGNESAIDALRTRAQCDNTWSCGSVTDAKPLWAKLGNGLVLRSATSPPRVVSEPPAGGVVSPFTSFQGTRRCIQTK